MEKKCRNLKLQILDFHLNSKISRRKRKILIEIFSFFHSKLYNLEAMNDALVLINQFFRTK